MHALEILSLQRCNNLHIHCCYKTTTQVAAIRMACAQSLGIGKSQRCRCHLLELCVIGRYAVQYEDGDKEEFVISELKKKKNMLQPAGVEQRTDFEELDRLYAEAQAEWAAGMSHPVPCLTTVLEVAVLSPRHLSLNVRPRTDKEVRCCEAHLCDATCQWFLCTLSCMLCFGSLSP